jgi:hypothetical protein
MSMYVTVLSGALDRWDSDLDDEALLDYVRDCRAALPARDLEAGMPSESALVAEVGYDRGLVCLATRYGIDASPRDFAHPKIERERLEFELVTRNVDLRVQGPGSKSAGEPPNPDSSVS